VEQGRGGSKRDGVGVLGILGEQNSYELENRISRRVRKKLGEVHR